MAPEVAGCERLRVLVVDDDRDAADSLAILVQLWGHDVLTEYDAASAFEGARSYRPHVVLLDIGLPKMDGHQLAREIRREVGTEAILIAVTGYGDEAHRSRCEGAFDHYLVKPAPVEEMERLLALVKMTLKLHRRCTSDTMQAGTTFALNEASAETPPTPAPPAAVPV
jgi:DNA-binding response OmpR family regulator